MAEPQPGQQMTPEQIGELKEKIKNMSPGELREFQKKQCIFCHIVSGKVQAKKIYEDDKCLAVLDINPANPGHILLLPKEHYSIMPQLPEEEIEHIFMVAKALSNAALRGLEATGTNIIAANGPAAGQKAQHFMVHVIPRKEEDGLEFVLPQKAIPDKELEAVRKKISDKLPKPGQKKFEAKSATTISVPEIKPLERIIPKPGKNELRGKLEGKKAEAAKAEAMQQPLREGKSRVEKKAGKKKAKPKEKKPEAKGDVNLDDIAGVLGVK